jgi:hypothetical protein
VLIPANVAGPVVQSLITGLHEYRRAAVVKLAGSAAEKDVVVAPFTMFKARPPRTPAMPAMVSRLMERARWTAAFNATSQTTR